MSLDELPRDLQSLIADSVDVAEFRQTSREMAAVKMPCGKLDPGGPSRWPIKGCEYTVTRVNGCMDCLGRTHAEFLETVRDDMTRNGQQWRVEAKDLINYGVDSPAGHGLVMADVLEVHCESELEIPDMWRKRLLHVPVTKARAFDGCTGLTSSNLP
jgi:hypothetical protein